VPQKLSLILGTKLEHNDFTGLEHQPGVRLLLTPDNQQTFWASFARAVRTPTRLDSDGRVNLQVFQPSPASPPFEISVVGNPAVKSEVLQAFELGYRRELTSQLSVDVSAFSNDYDRHTVYETSNPQLVFAPVPHFEVISNITNSAHARSYGGEISVNWHPTQSWRVAADYSLLKLSVSPDPSQEGDSPVHQAHLRSYYDLSSKWQLNAALSYVSDLVNSTSKLAIPAYARFDLGIVWHPHPEIEVGVWGRDLLDPSHPEFTNSADPTVLTYIPREFTARIIWRF
jgi:iron complex outermembrane receptor protein